MVPDKLKTIWQNSDRAVSSRNRLDETAISHWIKRNSATSLSNLSRDSLLEAGLLLIVLAHLDAGIVLRSGGWKLLLLTGVLNLLFAFFIAVLFRQFRITNRIKLGDRNLRETLTDLTEVLKGNLVWLKRVSLFGPVGFLCGVPVCFKVMLDVDVFMDGKGLAIAACFTAVLIAAYYPVHNLIVRLQYSNPIKDLEDCLKELQEPERGREGRPGSDRQN